MNDGPWLTYFFNGFKFEFYNDWIEVENPVNKDKYKIQLDPYSNVPFLITLIEKG